MKFFNYDNVNNEVLIDDENILLIREFESLMSNERNKTKEDKTGKKKLRLFKELKYLYLFFDWASPYFSYSEQERHKEALLDSGLTDEEFSDVTFNNACKKYQELQDSILEIRMLKAAMRAVEEVIHYFETLDSSERDPVTGKPILKTKDIIAEIKGCKDLITSLRDLETQVKKGLEKENFHFFILKRRKKKMTN